MDATVDPLDATQLDTQEASEHRVNRTATAKIRRAEKLLEHMA